MKKILKNVIWIVPFVVFFTLSSAIFRAFQNYRLLSPRAFMFDIAFALFFASFSYVFKSKKAKLLYFLIVSFILCLFPLTQLIYYGFFSDYYSLTRLTSIKEFFYVRGETAKSFKAVYLIVVLIPILLFLIQKKIFKETNNRRIMYFLITSAMSIVLVFFVKSTFVNRIEDKTQVYLTDDYLYSTVFNKNKAVERFGLYTYEYRDLYNILNNFLKKNNEENVKTINEYFSNNIRIKQNNEMTNIFKGKNLVFIVGESLNRWAINEEITPTLYKMSKEGVYLNNYYSPYFESSTVDAEYILNTGMMPSFDFGNTAYVFSDNTYSNSLGNLFKEQDYQTVAFHNSRGDFYNRYQYYPSLGYDKFYDAQALNIEIPENFGYNWPNDSELFYKSTDVILNDYANKEQPFYSYMLTVACHTPYDENRTYLKDQYEKVKTIIDTNSEVQYYFAAAMDLDDGIKYMIQQFENAGILDDTVFIITGDHYSYSLYHDLIWEYDQENKGDFFKIHRVPLIIWSSETKDGVLIEDLTSQFETYPTICNMFGLDFDLTYCVGNDIFDFEKNTVIFGAKDTWEDENVLFYKNEILYRYKENFDYSYVDSKAASILEKINIYQLVLKENYFKTKRKVG